MSIIKSFSVCDKNGKLEDMLYIQHETSNFSIIRIIRTINILNFSIITIKI